jgi:drug/metabolite transporter (DMT)-like permease
MSRIWAAHLALVGVNVLYGLNYSIASYAMQAVHPFTLVLLRVLTAGTLFWLWHSIAIREKVRRRDIPLLALLGLFGVASNQLMFLLGLHNTTEINASLIMITTPVLVLFLSHFLIRERITGLKLLGIALGGAGAFLIIGFGRDFSFGSTTWKGDLLVFLNALSYGLYLVLAKPLLARYNAITVIKWAFLFGLLIVAGFGGPHASDTTWSAIESRSWWAIAYVLICTTFLAYLLNMFALNRVNPSVVSIYIYSQPLIASTVALIRVSDVVTWTKVVAAVLIFAGVMLVSGVGSGRKPGQTKLAS